MNNILFKIINEFLKDHIDAETFKIKYITSWKKLRDANSLEELKTNEQSFVDQVFSSADSFCSEEELMDEYDIDEVQLRVEIIESAIRNKTFIIE